MAGTCFFGSIISMLELLFSSMVIASSSILASELLSVYSGMVESLLFVYLGIGFLVFSSLRYNSENSY